jgi:signal transduction histidine kinase
VSATHPYRILIIDDDVCVHQVFANMLSRDLELPSLASNTETSQFRRADFPVFTLDSAFNGEQGLAAVRRALAENQPYTMAFVDMRMKSGWNGIDTIGHIWRESADLQIVICTGHADVTWHDIIKRFGHTDRLLMLKKPFEVMDVRQIAYALAEKWNLFNQAKSHLEHLQKLVAERTAKLQESNRRLEQTIVEQRQAERERRTMEIQLHHAQKLESVGQLAAGIAHEVNTPNQYIGDNIRFLQKSFAQIAPLVQHYQQLLRAVRVNAVTPELIATCEKSFWDCDLDFLVTEIPRAMEQSLEGVNSVTRIVHSMRDFSHPGRGEKIPVDLNQTVESTLVVAAHEWKYVANLVKDFQPDMPRVLCLPGELNQVILNLVVNAAHAIATANSAEPNRKGTITVSTRHDGEWAEINVRDTGTGIPEEIRDKVFEPFFTTREVGKGTGQGLAIARNVIVARHGGTLTFQSQEGVGTVFTIRLPARPTATPVAEEKAA